MEIRQFYRPPVPGVIAFLLVFIWQGLGHTVMILMEKLLGTEYVYHSSFVIGCISIWMIWYGRNKSEFAATMWGFTGGSLLWTTWVEFWFHLYARVLDIAPVVASAKIVKPEYVLMPAVTGMTLVTLVHFLFNKDTRCNAFMWIQRALNMDMGPRNSGKDRNIAMLVATETIYVTLFCYLMLLFTYMTGEQSWVTYSVFLLNFIWALYLIPRMLKFARMAPALRYAIPTAIILWNCVEIMGRWALFTEIWVHPEKYSLQMAAVGIGLLVAIGLAVLSPPRQPAAE